MLTNPKVKAAEKKTQGNATKGKCVANQWASLVKLEMVFTEEVQRWMQSTSCKTDNCRVSGNRKGTPPNSATCQGVIEGHLPGMETEGAKKKQHWL